MKSLPKQIRSALGSCAALAVLAWTGDVAASGQESGPSFDCRKAKTHIEKAICADASLGQVDRALSQTYATALQKASEEQRRLVRQLQREWLRRRSAICPDDPVVMARIGGYVICLNGAYFRQQQILEFFAGNLRPPDHFRLPKEVISDEALLGIAEGLAPHEANYATHLLRDRVSSSELRDEAAIEAAFGDLRPVMLGLIRMRIVSRWELSLWQRMICDEQLLASLLDAGLDPTNERDESIYHVPLYAASQCRTPATTERLLNAGFASEKLSELRFAYLLSLVRTRRIQAESDRPNWLRVENEILRRRNWEQGQWGLFDAINNMLKDPKRADAALQRYDNYLSWLYRSMLYLLTEPPSTERDARVRELMERSAGVLDFATLQPFDGTLENFVSAFAHFSASEKRSVIDEVPADLYLPCNAVLREPRLLGAMNPIYGGMRDSGLPTHDCNSQQWQLPDAVVEYLETIKKHYATDECMSGTIRAPIFVGIRALEARVKLAPSLFLSQTAARDYSPERVPLDPTSSTGRALSVTKRQFEQQLRPMFFAARAELARYYRSKFELSPNDANLAAHRALFGAANAQLGCNMLEVSDDSEH